MRFASLGSGSRGNALLVEAGHTRVLIDAGFGPREMQRRLDRLGVDVDSITAVLITHEHADHVGGAFACAARFGWELLLTAGTFAACRQRAMLLPLRTIDSHDAIALEDFKVEPFPVPHDAREPVQFVIGDGASRLGVITDAGHVTPHMVGMLSHCDSLVIECNHDIGLLERGAYPAPLKRRIAGPHGHLDNDAAAGLLARVAHGRLRHVVAAHLSEQNNTPDLATRALGGVLGCAAGAIGVATQDGGLDWRGV